MKQYTLRDYQIECQEKMIYKRNLVTIFMRAGKTLTMLDHAKKIKARTVLWFVDSSLAAKQLKKEYKEYGFKYDLTIVNYRSLKKYANTEFDFIVFDECQTVKARHIDAIRSMKYFKMVFMSGSIIVGSYDYNFLLKTFAMLHVYHYGYEEAIKNNSISDFTITIHEVPLSNEKNIKVSHGSGYFYTSELASYVNLSRKISEEDIATKLSIYRAKFLNTLDSKVQYAKEYMKIMQSQNKRFLIFCEDSTISKKISQYTYNSKTSDDNLNKFNNGEIDHLVLVNKGSSSITYNNLDACLLLSVNSSSHFVLQRIFRTVLFKKDKIADINIVISKDTIQETWLESVLSDIEDDKIIKNES